MPCQYLAALCELRSTRRNAAVLECVPRDARRCGYNFHAEVVTGGSFRAKHKLLIALLPCVFWAALANSTDALAEGAFDGVYRGSKRVAVSSNDNGCVVGTSFDTVTIIIKNNHFLRPEVDVVLSVDVAADGTFSARAMGGGAAKLREIKGKITGDSFEADQGSPYCIWHLSLKRS